jgi:hypothetical protein
LPLIGGQRQLRGSNAGEQRAAAKPHLQHEYSYLGLSSIQALAGR